MKVTLTVWAIVISGLSFTLGPPKAHKIKCQEDMSCWSWPTMGNHRRGIIVDGGRLIVGPKRFCQLPARIRHAQHISGDPTC